MYISLYIDLEDLFIYLLNNVFLFCKLLFFTLVIFLFICLFCYWFATVLYMLHLLFCRKNLQIFSPILAFYMFNVFFLSVKLYTFNVARFVKFLFYKFVCLWENGKKYILFSAPSSCHGAPETLLISYFHWGNSRWAPGWLLDQGWSPERPSLD